MRRYTIDRFEGAAWAVLEDEVLRQFPPTFFMDNGVPATTEI